MFRTVDIDQVQGPRVSPVYFIDNKTEQIIAEQAWVGSPLYNDYYPGYLDNVVVQGEYETGNVSKLRVSVKKFVY